ncbi:MAG: Trk system potassium transporter TrkA, partial [Erysipelotrichaceae bacterium]|nr:Trk system potassium transporter TrkA [Erysipelotrichaceae bacterium]
MEIVILGGGKLGQELCYDLNEDGHEITLIDTDSVLVNKLVEELDIQGIIGSGTD